MTSYYMIYTKEVQHVPFQTRATQSMKHKICEAPDDLDSVFLFQVRIRFDTRLPSALLYIWIRPKIVSITGKYPGLEHLHLQSMSLSFRENGGFTETLKDPANGKGHWGDTACRTGHWEILLTVRGTV